jgi:hypothetical protein
MPARKPPRKIIVLIDRCKRLKDLLKDGTSELKGEDGIEAQLLAEFEAMGISTITVQLDEGPKVTATAVQGVQEVLDPEALRKCVGQEVWDQIAPPVQVLDKALLEDAIARGVIAPGVLATCSESKPKKPYVLISEAKESKPAATLVRAGRAKSAAAKKIGR